VVVQSHSGDKRSNVIRFKALDSYSRELPWFRLTRITVEEQSLKSRARSVQSFVCLIVFHLFNFMCSAVAQATPPDSSKSVFINLGKTSLHFLEDQCPANVSAPGFYGPAWQQAVVPYSTDR
jgi:hypothetical protein